MDPAVAALVLTGPAEADPPSAVCRASTLPVVTSRACHRGSLSRLPSLSCAAPEVLPAAVVAGLTARRRCRVPRQLPPAARCRRALCPLLCAAPVATHRRGADAHRRAPRQLPPATVRCARYRPPRRTAPTATVACQ